MQPNQPNEQDPINVGGAGAPINAPEPTGPQPIQPTQVSPASPAPAPVTPVSPSQPGPVSPPQPTPDSGSPQPVTGDFAPAAPKGLGSDGTTALVANDYISNPFLNAARGLVMILQNNPGSIMLITFLAIVAYIVSYFGSIFLMALAPLLFFGILLVELVIYLIFIGGFYEIAGKSAKGIKVSTSEAFGVGLNKSIYLLVIFVLAGTAIGIGFLFFIIPGFYLAGRLVLAPFILFEENKGPLDSLKRSWELTKGAVNDMIGSIFTASFLGVYGLLAGATLVAPFVGRYHDLVALKESGGVKPKTHWLNFVGYVFFLLFVVGVLALIAITTFAGIQQKAIQSDPYSSPSSSEFFDETDPNTLPLPTSTDSLSN